MLKAMRTQLVTLVKRYVDSLYIIDHMYNTRLQLQFKELPIFSKCADTELYSLSCNIFNKNDQRAKLNALLHNDTRFDRLSLLT